MRGVHAWRRLLEGVRDGLVMALVVAGSAGLTWLIGA